MIGIELREKLKQIDLEGLMCISIEKTDTDIEEDVGIITFSEELYLQNREMLDEFIKKLCSYKKEIFKSIMLNSKYHMNNTYFNIIANNESLKKVTLFNYELSKDDFEILKQNKSIESIETESVAKELENCYDSRLKAVLDRFINNYIRVADIIYHKSLAIVGSLTDEQINDFFNVLEKRQVTGKIEIYPEEDSKYTRKIISKVIETQKDREEKDIINLYIDNRESFNYKYFTNEEENKLINVITKTDEKTDMNRYIKTEEKLNELISPIKEYENELSPFEKALWLFNIVSSYKKYLKQEDEEDWRISHCLNRLLFSDKIVCEGFSFLFQELATRVGLDVFSPIVCTKRSIRKKDEYNHRANLCFIKDKKYDIYDILLADATGDNHKDKDLWIFTHFLIEPNKCNNHIDEIYVAGYSLLSIKDKDEFIEQITGDDVALSTLIQILKRYYPEDEIFRVGFNEPDAAISYYKGEINHLFEMSKNINPTGVTEEKIERAITHIERIKNPNVTEDELLKKLEYTFEIYRKLDNFIYPNTEEEKKFTI